MPRFTHKLLTGILASAFAVSAADYSAWTNHKTITLNTTVSGANVTTNQVNFPVLIRLGSNEAAILSAANNGASIRFSKSDNATPLAYQIESWSSTSAVIWVKVDTVYGNSNTQSIRLHYTNGAAVSESNGPAVFDTAAGYRGVWHLQDSTGNKTSDATVLNTNATFYNAPKLVDGLIGKAINMNQPDGPTLATANHLRAAYNATNNNFKVTSANGLTLSVWVKRNSSTGGNEQGIFGRYNWGVNARQAMLATNNSEAIRLFRSINGTNASGQETNFGNQTIVDGQWMHIAATLKNGSQILYVDGVQDVAQTTATLGSLDSVWATKPSDLAFGHMAPDHTGNGANQAFNGVMDEARYFSGFRTADWLKLEVANQKLVNTLVDIGLPSAPGAPTGVTGVAGNTQVVVSWVAPTTDGGSPITGYKAMAVADTTKTCSISGGLSCTVTGLTNGTAYTFVVRAVNIAGSSVTSAASAAVTPALQAPSAPNNVSATAGAGGSGSVVVAWTVPATNGGSAITGYKAMAVSDTSKSCTTANLTCTVTGLTIGTTYTFVVKATNAIGTSPASAPSPAVIPPVTIAPGSLMINVGRFTKAYTFQLPEAAVKGTETLTMTISDVTGKTVWDRTINPAQSQARTITWNGLSSKGTKVSAGMYIVRIHAANASGSQDVIKAGVKLQRD